MYHFTWEFTVYHLTKQLTGEFKKNGWDDIQSSKGIPLNDERMSCKLVRFFF